jgi:malto-oligosyltrehalose trehalohydrolase
MTAAVTPFGPELTPDGVTFRIWAPAARSVDLMLERPHPMRRVPGGWYEIAIAGAHAGTRYAFRIDGEITVPDPASHFQPDDVSGPSEVIDHGGFPWQAQDWRGRPWHEAVTLELHVGAFTPQGTFRSAIDKLDHLVATGITAIELMPLADFAGRWNWGYDGVLPYAPDSSYGRPDDLKALIDAAHRRGLMVFLDVVYNHFGPEGNYLGRYAPAFFIKRETPWGQAIDYRVPEVRAFAIDNARHWLQHYRFDGLRLDAVHAIVQPGTPSVLEDLSRAVGALARETGRQIHLILENDGNQASVLDPLADPPSGKFRAQWNDDYHHVWHVFLTGESGGYYQDYVERPLDRIARALAAGFIYQGEASAFRGGLPHGEPPAGLSPLAFVNFLQNHDQIGNRPLGDRLTTQIEPQVMEAALAVLLLAPMPPMLFMGEEWGCRRPFPFFCDFQGDLAEAVRRGRRHEFADAYARFGTDVPDPLAETTFRAAVLDWGASEEPDGRRRLAFVRALLDIRRRELMPHLANVRFGSARVEAGVVVADWQLNGARTLLLVANLSGQQAPRPNGIPERQTAFGEPPPPVLPSWSVFWSIGET